MSGEARPLHVERTPDPAVLRWVCHEPSLTSGRLVAGPSPLGRLIDSGVVESVEADRGDVLITATDWTSDRLSVVTDAVRSELDRESNYRDSGLFADPGASTGPLDLVEARRLIAEAVDAVAAEHGGKIEVVAVVGDEVQVSLHGACDGCSAADSTLVDRAQSALRRRSPTVTVRAVGRRGRVLFRRR